MRTIILFLIALSLLSCSPANPPDEVGSYYDAKSGKKYTLFTGRYEYVVIDHMPCLVWITPGQVGGITCDWSKWDGKPR